MTTNPFDNLPIPEHYQKADRLARTLLESNRPHFFGGPHANFFGFSLRPWRPGYLNLGADVYETAYQLGLDPSRVTGLMPGIEKGKLATQAMAVSNRYKNLLEEAKFNYTIQERIRNINRKEDLEDLQAIQRIEADIQRDLLKQRFGHEIELENLRTRNQRLDNVMNQAMDIQKLLFLDRSNRRNNILTLYQQLL